MYATNAVIGGESSGGLTVRGHIKGKDGIYAAALLVEMIAVTGKKLSEIFNDIEAECGKIYMEERDYKFNQEGNQTKYFYTVEETTQIDFDRNDVRNLVKKYLRETDEVSSKLDAIEINTTVDHTAMFDVNDNFEDLVGA